MTGFEALILGVVQGLTEFLPVSSSGHLALGQYFLGIDGSQLVFDTWLHLATLLAVVLFFWDHIKQLSVRSWGVILISSVPAGLVGLLVYNLVEVWFGAVQLVLVALMITGIFNLLIDVFLKQQTQTSDSAMTELAGVNLQQGLVVGGLQALAIIPGISRSGSTVLGGLWRGLDRMAAFRFSFILSIPAILGASILQLIKAGSELRMNLPMLLGAGAAFVTSLLALTIFKRVMTAVKFSWFGVYCLVLGAGILIWV